MSKIDDTNSFCFKILIYIYTERMILLKYFKALARYRFENNFVWIIIIQIKIIM